ncbi:MAG TPA: dTDP-4-dehydrorhamnose reductase [archaeon]|nr:dTDP-4-dehydrorhamnose reductase [archaeon]
MKILVTGAAGMLGTDLTAELSSGHEVTGVDLDRCDITEKEAVLDLLRQERPELVIHTAAFTDVEGAEREPERAIEVNAYGAENVAQACRVVGARMLLISTDYVFDGTKREPYLESDEPNPINVYGRSKLEGERLSRAALPSVTVVRTAWLYGAASNNFLTKILKAAARQPRLAVVTDEVGSPTCTVDLSAVLRRMIELGAAGPLYHLAGSGTCSRYELAAELFSLLEIDTCELKPTVRESFPTLAVRPANSALASERLGPEGIPPLRPWREALEEFAGKHLKSEWRDGSWVGDDRKRE